MQSIRLRTASLLLMLLALPALAKQSDFQKPVDVVSKTQFGDMTAGTLTFSGNVVIRQGTILVHADKVIAVRDKEGQIKTITAYGKPATFHQLMDDGRPVDGRADTLLYQVSKQLVTLTGEAQVKQLESEVTGNVITYQMDKQQINAQSKGKQDRVHTVFIPNQFKKSDTKQSNK
ncbi:lipopolysaccharide transport periplasmic protein LptA [Dongshaea marina]|uniref:lipopolysaccharide transport periplasmic protein LptA n=1 Tax=Dongshaea marina TaxID=2047966 RepID=UPI00131EEC31|nr:lipopolysaccharide transport periplasmic protein LptA [Dongshaea marina]